MKTAILFDSSFYMEDEKIKENNFYVVPLSVNFENVTYKETPTDIEQTKEIFERIQNGKALPTSSQPASQDYINLFSKIKEDGYERCILLTISAKISGTFQGAKVAAQMFMEETDGLVIDVFNSNSVAQPASLIALELAKQVKATDGEISNEKIQEIINFYTSQTQIYFIVDTLDFLSYGGRIPASIAAIGNLFGIKPILQFKDGEIVEYTKVRSQKKGIKVILEQFQNNTNPDEKYSVIYTHMMGEKDAKKLYKAGTDIIPNSMENPINMQLGPVIGVHVGPGMIAYGWCPEYKG